MIVPNIVLQNRYRILRQIGQGGMGSVYEAIHEQLKSKVAVKQTLAPDDTLRRALEREARLLSNLRHPSLPKVIDHFTEGDSQFMVMEFIPGSDLSELLKQRQNAFSCDQVMTWADQLLDVLEYLHSRQPPVIHRDIKPQNLKLGERGEAILLDFGLAKGAPMLSRITSGSSILGYSLYFSPPEQMQGKGTDARSDLYSLAATLYHLITNITPPDALTRAMSLASLQTDPLRPANEVNALVSPEISGLLYTAMALNRDQRPIDASAMRGLLRQVLTMNSADSTILIGASRRDDVQRSLENEEKRTSQKPQTLYSKQTAIEPVIQSKVINDNQTETEQIGHAFKIRSRWITSAFLILLALAIITIFIFPTRKRDLPPQVLDGHISEVSALAFSADGKTLVSSSHDHTIKLWDVKTARLKQTLFEAADGIRCMALSPDGNVIAIGIHNDHTVKILDVVSGKIKQTLPGHNESITSVVFSPDGNNLASGSLDSTVKIWDARTGELKYTLTGQLEKGNSLQWIKHLAFSSDSKVLAAIVLDGEMIFRSNKMAFWDSETGKLNAWVRLGRGVPRSFDFLADSKTLIIGWSDRLQLLDTNSPLAPELIKDISALALSVSPDGRTLATSDFQEPEAILATKTRPAQLNSEDMPDPIFDLEMSVVKLWDAHTFELKKILELNGGPIQCIAFSPDSRMLVAVSARDHRIKLWRWHD